MKKNHTECCQNCRETHSSTSLFTHINWYEKVLERPLVVHGKNCKHAHALFWNKTSGNLSQGNNPEERKSYKHRFLTHCLWYLKIRNNEIGTSLVVQWLRIRLPMQGTRVRALVREDPTCHGATKPVRYNYWACALEPMLRNKRSHRSEKPSHPNEE